jgi:hypothetical protein
MNELAKTAGYDVANLWMNLAKILILVIAIHQNTLKEQLGLDMFSQQFHTFYAGEAEAVPNESLPGRTQVVTKNDPEFSVTVLPLSIWDRYDCVRVRILEVWKNRQRISTGFKEDPFHESPCASEGRSYKEYPWPDGQGALHTAHFNLEQLLGGPPSSGEYAVKFGVLFRNGSTIHYSDGSGESSPGTESEPTKDRGKNVVWLKYVDLNEMRFGDFPVVQGQWFELPRDLRGKEIKWEGWRTRDPRTNVWPSDLEPGQVVKVESARSYPRRVSPGGTYEQWGSYEENGKTIDFSVSFVVVRNQRPRSAYRGRQERDDYSVLLYTDNFFDAEDGSYQYFNLSRTIIDPDGKSAAGLADVRVKLMDRLVEKGVSGRFTLIQDQPTQDFRLKVNNGIGRAFPQIGSEAQVSLLAHDEFDPPQNIDIRIIRRR